MQNSKRPEAELLFFLTKLIIGFHDMNKIRIEHFAILRQCS